MVGRPSSIVCCLQEGQPLAEFGEALLGGGELGALALYYVGRERGL